MAEYSRRLGLLMVVGWVLEWRLPSQSGKRKAAERLTFVTPHEDLQHWSALAFNGYG